MAAPLIRCTAWLIALAGPLALAPARAVEPPPPAAASAPATTAGARGLLDSLQLAREHDPGFLAAQAVSQADREKLSQARSALFPAIFGTAEKKRTDAEVITDSGIVSRPSGQAKYDSSAYTLNITQPLFNMALFSGLSQAKATVRKAEAELAAAKQDLIVRAAEAYFGVLGAQDNLDLARAEKTAIARQLDVAQGRLDVGMATITDVHDARARFELAGAQEIDAQNELADRREALREMTGEYFAQLRRLGEDVPIIRPDPPDASKWIETARGQNFSLQARRAAMEVAREEVSIQRAGYAPTLDLTGTHTRTDSDGSISGPGVRTDDDEVALQLTIPIFQGGLVGSRTREAARRLSAAEQELERELRATERRTRSAYLGVESAGTRIGALKQAVIASTSALEAKQEGYEAGINTNLDVLDAQRDRYRAERDFFAARYEYVLNLLRLKRAAGTLTDDDLARADRWLEGTRAIATVN